MRFGFWIDGNTLEYALAASGKLTIKKFDEMFYKLENEYPVKDVSDKPNTIRKEIQVDGDVKAVFSKSGRTHDVNIVHAPEI